MSKKKLKPGQKAPRSGQYEIVGPKGGKTGEERTVVKNEPMPPTPRKGMSYVLVDPTKHKAKASKISSKKTNVSKKTGKTSKSGGHGSGGGVDD